MERLRENFAVAECFDPYYTWLGIPPEEQPADHYRLLGVRQFEPSEQVIINAADQRMAYLRTLQTGKRSKESQDLLNEIATAQVCLLDGTKKLAYDEALRRKLAPASAASLPPLAAAQLPQPGGQVESPAAPLTPIVLPRPAHRSPRVSARPRDSLSLSTAILVGGGSLFLGIIVFVSVLIWAATRPA